MKIPGRLIWNLFLAFWLVASLAFCVEVGMLELDNFQSGDPGTEAILSSEAWILRQFAFDPTRQHFMVWPLIIGTVMSALFSGYMAYFLAWPLAYLKRVMSDAALGRVETWVKPMAGDCSQTTNQLKLLVTAQQHLVHEIAHELRSPLMRMQAAIGLLRQDPTRQEMVERIERESVRMDTLIEALLSLARLQGHPEGIQREPLDVIELLVEITENAQFEAGMKGCKVSLQTCPAFISCVSGELLYRSFENVIRNAVRHTRPGTTVAVFARINPDASCLNVWITDQGRGVANERLHSIFQPFVRGMTEAGTGFGLGLAIATRAVEMHGGRIMARNELSGGLTVEISLPYRA